jgi:hypothetical protein
MIMAVLTKQIGSVAVTGLVLGLNVVAVIGAATLLGSDCRACRQQLVVYFIGLPLVLVTFLAALGGAREMIIRRMLMFAGLVFAVNLYLGIALGDAPWSADRCGIDCGPQSAKPLIAFLWNIAFSAALLALALWAAFRRMESNPG